MTSATDGFNMENCGSNDVKREKEVMPKSIFLMVLCIIRNVAQDNLSKKSDKELCEIRNKKPCDNEYILRDDKYTGQSIAHGILRSRYNSLVEFNNKTLREAVLLYRIHTKQAEKKYGPIAFWDVSKVTNMVEMFEGCQLFNADLSHRDVSSVTNMMYMFNGCKSFNADLSNWNVRKVTKMTLMFYGCKTFNADLSNWGVSKVTKMTGMFGECMSFNSDLSEWDVSSVTHMAEMFERCESMNKLPEWYWYKK